MPYSNDNLAAFRCKNCGHLESAGAAGENDKPHACSACGSGVTFDRRGIKTTDPDNWEVLADLPPDRVAKLGIDQVARHEGKSAGTVTGRHVAASASENGGAEDKAG